MMRLIRSPLTFAPDANRFSMAFLVACPTVGHPLSILSPPEPVISGKPSRTLVAQQGSSSAPSLKRPPGWRLRLFNDPKTLLTRIPRSRGPRLSFSG